jgi:A118 family predicted phage portal protein
MKEIVKQIIEKIAERLGFTLYKKADIDFSYDDDGLNPTAIAANVISNIAIDDSDIIITGENARADKMREYASYYEDEIENTACEVALGTGDCILRPFTKEDEIGINVIGNDNFTVTSAVANKLLGVVMMLDDYEDNDNDTYRLFESQELVDGVCKIRRYTYKNNKEIPITETAWKDIETETDIVADQLLLGRIKCPTINRKDYNSVEGVPITYGNDELIEQVQDKFEQYNDEFDRKKSRIFADRLLFKRDDKGDLSVTDSQEIVKLRGDDRSISSLMETYSPEIRESDYKSGNDFNMAMLEMACGLSRGVFTKPETAFATATEMKNSLKKTFAFVKRFRRRIEIGNTQLFNAIDILMNVNNITPQGEWEVQYQWSYDYVEESREKFSQLLQGNSINAISRPEVRSWTLNIPLEQAKEEIEEMDAEALQKAQEMAALNAV